MDDPISYAMRNKDAVSHWLSFNAPGDLKDWSFLVLELIILTGAISTILHARRHHKENGNYSAFLTLLSAFAYGLLMDIGSYYTVENFWHGEFSVMLLHNRLPLYIVLFYPVVIYHIIMTIRRFNFSRTVEVVGTAFFAGLFYMIFDNLGPMLNWWIWDRADPTTWPYLNAVPVTSYFWWFSFTGVFALVSRVTCWDWVQQRKSRRMIGGGVALTPVVVIAAGTALFVPYNLLAHNGMLALAAALYAVLFGASGLIFTLNFKRPRIPRDRLLMLFPLLYLAALLIIFVAKFQIYFSVDAKGLSAEGLAVGNPIVIVFAIIATLTITLFAHPTDVPAHADVVGTRKGS